MRAASRALQRATLATTAVEDGQESMKKLAFAPLGFLSLGGNVSYIASILASAVTFLEGYSAEDLETNVRLVQDDNGEFVAHTELKLVPYAFPQQDTPVNIAPKAAVQTSTAAAPPQISHRFSMSRTISLQTPNASTELELERFKSKCQNNSIMADVVANEILLTTDSVDVANAVLHYSAQVGLTIPRTTLAELMTRMAAQESSLAQTVFREFEFEMNVGTTLETSFLSVTPSSTALPSTKKRKQSKLERLRSSPLRSSRL